MSSGRRQARAASAVGFGVAQPLRFLVRCAQHQLRIERHLRRKPLDGRFELIDWVQENRLSFARPPRRAVVPA